MPRGGELINAADGVREGLASRALHRLRQVGRVVMGVLDLASPIYDGLMDRVARPGRAARRAEADNILEGK